MCERAAETSLGRTISFGRTQDGRCGRGEVTKTNNRTPQSPSDVGGCPSLLGCADVPPAARVADRYAGARACPSFARALPVFCLARASTPPPVEPPAYGFAVP